MRTFLLFLCFLGGTLFAYPNHSPNLTSTVKMLYQLEETRQLLSSVEAEGGIAIQSAHLGKSATNAAWMPDERTIYINFSNPRSAGSVLRSVIFELQNALDQRQFDQIDRQAMQGQISKQKYIESVEYLEYTHALNTVQILKKGISQGLFPSDAGHWPIASTFAEHYQVQIEAGHSKMIGDLWESLSRNRRS